MGEHKRKKNTDIKVDSPPIEVNNTGYREEPAKYMAAPAKGFWASFKKAFGREPQWLNKKSIVIVFMLLFPGMSFAEEDYSKYLPNPVLTPGDVRDVDAEYVCTHKTSEVRNVPKSVHNAVFKQYGMDNKTAPCPCEVDHLINLWVGGSNDISNLWPQPYEGEYNAHMKDKLETRLHKLVCYGKITLEEAQEAISTDWVKAYKKYIVNK